MENADLEAASRLLTRCYRFLGREEGYSRRQLDNVILVRGSATALRAQRSMYRFTLAWEGQELLGLVALQDDQITKLYVDPSRHRQGIGSSLWRAAAAQARAAGHPELWLVTSGYGIPLYRAMGMEVTGTRPVPRGPLTGRTVTELRCRL